MMGEMFGERPSNLLGWIEEEDNFERLLFDMGCMIEYNKEKAKDIKDGELDGWERY